MNSKKLLFAFLVSCVGAMEIDVPASADFSLMAEPDPDPAALLEMELQDTAPIRRLAPVIAALAAQQGVQAFTVPTRVVRGPAGGPVMTAGGPPGGPTESVWETPDVVVGTDSPWGAADVVVPNLTNQSDADAVDELIAHAPPPMSAIPEEPPFSGRRAAILGTVALAPSLLKKKTEILSDAPGRAPPPSMMANASVEGAWTAAPFRRGPQVSGQAAALDPSGKVLLFGGLTNGAGSPCTNEVWRYESLGWKQVKTTGEGPGKRMYPASAVLGNDLYVIGGWDPEAPGTGGTFKDEVFRLNLDSLKWEKLPSMPYPVSRHTAVTVGNKIVVQTFKGTLVIGEDGAVRSQETTGDAPLEFSMATAVALNDKEMLHIFGSTRTQGMTPDVYVLNTETWHWTKLRATGDVPGPRASAAAASLDDDSVVVFGGAGLGGDYDGGKGLRPFDETYKLTVGCSTLDVDHTTGEGADIAVWERVQADPRPEARVAASLTPLKSGAGAGKGTFLLQGGWNPKTGETYSEPEILGM